MDFSDLFSIITTLAVPISLICVIVLLIRNRHLIREQVNATRERDAQDKQCEQREKELLSCKFEIEKEKAEITKIRQEALERIEKIKRFENSIQEKVDTLNQAREHYEAQLKKISTLSTDSIREEILKVAKEKATEEARRIRREILEKSEEEYINDARRLLITTMQRIAPQMNGEESSVLVPIPAEEVKGRLIGREGRNIKSFEQTTGTTLIIDDTPGSVLVSCFDPFRRHVAALALRRLIEDGRIHPQNIEQFVKTAEQESISATVEIGTKTCDDLGIFDVPENIRELLGKLQYRLSINQNTLSHSVETALLAGTLAAELGLDVGLATRAGLFHDIGKAIDAENEDAHALAGARLLRQAGEQQEVVNAVEAHHRDVAQKSIYAPLVMLADSISATRPGARSSTRAGYAERIKSLEAIAKRFRGVIDVFAIQAGHEVRVIVSSDEVNDAETRALALKIRTAIEEELTYPGKIKVVVIRELRIIEEAL